MENPQFVFHIDGGNDIPSPIAEVCDQITSDVFFENLVWMTSEEAAKYLRKTANALRIAVCRGQLRARKWRRRLYFKKIELDRLLEASQQMGGI